MPPSRRTAASSSVTRLFAAIFDPPYRGLPILIWVYFVWCYLVYPDSAILHGNLPDSDDYMYLDQMLDWLRGQGWYDNVQHRLDAPGGVPIVFSRLTEFPMAVIVWLLSPFLGAVNAALVMAAAVPPILFGGLLIALRWVGENFMDKKRAWATSFVVLFAAYLIYQFSPGHIDHHGLTALLVLIGFGCAVRMIKEPQNPKWPWCAGLVLAFSLVVGLEVLPSLALISAWLGLWAMAQGKNAARTVFIYGCTLFAFSGLFLANTALPSDWQLFDALRFSIVYVVLTAGILLCCTGVYLASLTRQVWLRYAAGFGLAILCGGLYFYTFPALIAGPYGAMNPDLARIMFESISEALPIVKTNGAAGIFLHLIWPLMGLAAAIWFWRRAAKREQWLWGMLTLLLGAHILLGAFYQIRFMVFAQLFCTLAMTAYLQQGIVWINKNCRGRSTGLMQLGLLLLVAPLPMLILPAIADNRPFNTGIMLFPVAIADYECDMRSVAKHLNRTDAFGARPRVIMNEMESGPELLFRTPHNVLAAPFHTDVKGNLDAAHFFSAEKDDQNKAYTILGKHGATLVLLCRKMIPLYHNAHGASSLAERLEQGDIPWWLHRIHYPDEQDYLLFSVTPAGGS